MPPAARNAGRRPALLQSLAALAVLFLAGCVTKPKPPAKPEPPVAAELPPPTPREFRGVWVATVNNIDWPSKRGLPVAQQRAEIVAILDRAKALNLNAVVFQVRPAADALYASSLEPWSEYLTGKQGQSPGYDPLAVWIAEAHRRGLELHAWFNPYRARHNEAKSPLAKSHIANTHPRAVKKYGELLWMDPGESFAAERTLAVIRDVVRRYDVDGVHIDDYFYPYPIAKPLPPKAPKDAKPDEIDFPDDPAWGRYRKAGGKLARADWRRQNVDQLVEKIHAAVHAEKPWVKFGISPFGLGRPDRRPAGIKGFSQYDKLYADVELWLAHGWLDYFVPQLYWPSTAKEQSFSALLDYWVAQNRAGRNLYAGLFTSAISDEKKWSPNDIAQQIALTRQRANAGATGHVHFSSVALMENRKGIAQKLAPLYAAPALVPASPWLGTKAPAAPTLTLAGAREVKIAAASDAALFVVWRRSGPQWRLTVQPARDVTIELSPGDEAVAVSAVNRLGNESPRASLTLDSAGRANRPDEPRSANGSAGTPRPTGKKSR
ncbi:MAG: family 10 glycosylhydrolase [Opitutae bacterium]|nr:family 10 glycosylhydrolase [Opitutae bacterium]